jgi:hypothetical protein
MAKAKSPKRGLMVLADGAQAAFAAGAVAELARAGRSWAAARGAGLGAQVALLGVLGEAAEAERRWVRQGAGGCPLLGSLVARGRERLTGEAGLLLLPDPIALPGWLDPVALEEHLAPDLAGLPERLHRAGATCAVAVEDLTAGRAGWVELAAVTAAGAAAALRAAVRFPAGWGPVAGGDDAAPGLRWGGAGVASVPGEWPGVDEAWDVVCGFPVPPVTRPALGGSLLELVQRRDEVRAGAAAAGRPVIAPAAASWAAWAARDGAELGVEYPLPWERNGELVGRLVEYGRFAARAALADPA